MAEISTIRVVHPTAPGGFMIINEGSLTDDHELWSGAPAAPADTGLRVGKGPRGKWYVWLDQERKAGPFDTEAEAEAAATAGD